MSKYKFLETLTKEQLLALQNVSKDEDILKYIDAILSKSKLPSYESGRKIYIDDKYNDRYEEIAKNLRISDVMFIPDLVFRGKGNNAGLSTNLGVIDLNVLLYANKDIQELASIYGIKDENRFSYIFFLGSLYDYGEKTNNIYTQLKNNKLVQETINRANYFSYLDEFFQNQEYVYKCEGSYNSIMYMKEFIYQMLSKDSNFSFENLFDEKEDKQKLVLEYFQDICKYLYNLRESVPNSRLSAFNNKISYAAKNEYKILKKHQQQFVDMLAFGTTLEKLENKDYEDFNRLLYVPNRFYRN